MQYILEDDSLSEVTKTISSGINYRKKPTYSLHAQLGKLDRLMTPH